jgi:iron complex outermembrane receptor protein
MGIGANYIDLYKISEIKNFDASLAPLPGSPPPVRDVSSDPSLVYVLPHDRVVYYAYWQDAWTFAPDWELTTGLRGDRYSDFGSTINPRLALVWQTSYRLTSKLLYGRAFRAPSFAELYSINNPVSLGNENLRPEIIDTFELAWDYRSSPSLQTGLNLFLYKARDIIRFVADPAPATTASAANAGEQNGHGLEITASWKPLPELHLNGNYAWQKSTDATTDMASGNTPQQQLFVNGEWGFHADWTLGAQAKYVGTRLRAAGDTRPDLPGYTMVDMTIRRKRIAKNWELAASVRNLLNTDAREPAGVFIPNDLPLARRNYYIEARYQL